MAARRDISSQAKKQLGANIARLREQRNLSVKELADLAYMSDGYLGEIEKGQKSTPGLRILLDLVNALQLGSIEELLSGQELGTTTLRRIGDPLS